MKQTDALIIAVALRYLAQDEERHEKVRARAEELRWQILHDNANQHTRCVGCVDTISRSRAIKDISEWATDILHPDRLIKEDAIHIMESLPSAETVQVVRCKDCIMTRQHDSYSKGNWCIIHRNLMQDDYFCADGRREP